MDKLNFIHIYTKNLGIDTLTLSYKLQQCKQWQLNATEHLADYEWVNLISFECYMWKRG